MKKTLGILVLCVILAISCVALVSCKGKKTSATTGPAVTLAPTTSAPEHVHTPEVIPAVEATCSAEGLTEGEKCACGEILKAQEPVAKLEHTPVTVPAVEATCTETGLTEGTKCSVCGEVIVAQEEIPLADHTLEVVPGTLATCTEAGTTDGEKCSVCGEITKKQEEVKALGHDFVNATPIATTKSDLITRGHVLQCYNCGEIDTDNVVKHTFASGKCTYCYFPESYNLLREDAQNPVAPYVYAEGSLLKVTNKARVFQTAALYTGNQLIFTLNIPEALKDTEITLVFNANIVTGKLATPYYELTVKNGLVSNVKKVTYDSATDSVVRVTLQTIDNTSTPLTFEYGVEQIINIYRWTESGAAAYSLRVTLGENTARYKADESITGKDYGVFADTTDAYYVSLDSNSYNTWNHAHVYGPEATCSSAQVCTICLAEANNGEKANHAFENKYVTSTDRHYRICSVCNAKENDTGSEHTGGSYCTVCGKPEGLEIIQVAKNFGSPSYATGKPSLLPALSYPTLYLNKLDGENAQGKYTVKLNVKDDVKLGDVYFIFGGQDETMDTLPPMLALSLFEGENLLYTDGNSDFTNEKFVDAEGDEMIKLAKGEYTLVVDYSIDPITNVVKVVATTSANGKTATTTIYSIYGNSVAVEGLYFGLYQASDAEFEITELTFTAAN